MACVMRLIHVCAEGETRMISRFSQRTTWTVLASLILAALACTSNDTLFIRLTETPVPTVTPTPLASDTRFKINDNVTIVGSAFQIMMATRPGPVESAVASLATCFADTQVQILDVSKNAEDSNDPGLYYSVQCGASSGWVPEYWLTPLEASGSAVVKSKDGKGATLYTNPDVASEPASAACPDGTTVAIGGLTLNPDATEANPDTNIYVQVTCDGATGYALESALARAGS
jgi:hypothetical protein